jgi:hypothetical protein
MVDGKILMEIIPGSNGEELLSNIEGVSIVITQIDRKGFNPRKGMLTTPKTMAKELVKDCTDFLIGRSSSPGAKGLEIVLYYKGNKIARTASEDVQPQTYYEIKGVELRALYSDWDCLNQIFGRI